MQEATSSTRTPSRAARPEKFLQLRSLVSQAVSDQVFPGAVVLVGKNGETRFHEAFGNRSFPAEGEPVLPMTDDTVFDVASLTQTVVTSTLVMLLLETNRLRLEDRVSRFAQGFGVLGKGAITILDLLSHTSGLPHWIPFYEELVSLDSGSRVGILASHSAKEYVYRRINELRIKPSLSEKFLFSDIGFMKLGEVIEILTGLRLDCAAQRFIFQPIGMGSSSFIDLSLMKRKRIEPVRDIIAPTELCPWRKRVICGEVHDDNAWAMGGVAGHGGLFTTASDLHRFATVLLSCFRNEQDYLSFQTIRRFWDVEGVPSSGTHRYSRGWEHPSAENGMNESGLHSSAVGASGFTGCSIWIEPKEGIDIILLTNRIHPTRNNKKIQSFRPELHRAVLAELR